MRHESCSKCSTSFPVSDLFLVNGRSYCQQCVSSVQATMPPDSPPPQRRVDLTTCAGCGKDSDIGEFATHDGIPMCEQCGANALAAEFPWWLKNSLVALTLLLCFALYHGRTYITHVRALYRAQRVAKTNDNEQIVKLLAPVVADAPGCKECALRLSLAYMKLGETGKGWEIVKGMSVTDDDEKKLLAELQTWFDKVDKAGPMLDETAELMNQNKYAEARKKIAEARAIYPPWAKLYDSYERGIASGEAFNRQDWDGFLAVEMKELEFEPKSPSAMAGVASALAAKYAATGDEHYRGDAERYLHDAELAAHGDKEAEARFAEYSERIRYRLRTREIIDKAEYDRRFRPAQKEKQS